MIVELNTEQVRKMLMYVAERIIESKPILTDIDSKIGDGDHGIGMALGMEKVCAALQSSCIEGKTPYDMFSIAGKTMLMSMGGASGVIFGSMYLGGAAGQTGVTMDAKAFADYFERSLEIIQKRGGASIGDKTMVDALAPAVDAMKKNYKGGVLATFRAAKEAAFAGVENTKSYVAKLGRAKSLGKRSIGYEDAGAMSVAIIFGAMEEFISNL